MMVGGANYGMGPPGENQGLGGPFRLPQGGAVGGDSSPNNLHHHHHPHMTSNGPTPSPCSPPSPSLSDSPASPHR